MAVDISKIPGGLSIDGLELKNGKCGCTSVLPCCYTWSKVKAKGQSVEFRAKAVMPETTDAFTWGYVVTKDGVTVSVTVEDARDKVIYSGYFPPVLEEWTSKGWEVLESTGSREGGVLYRCGVCRWLHKEDEAGPFSALPDDWRCPKCGVSKESFERI